MINKRTGVLCLLIFCIGMAPVLTAGANAIGHLETMPVNCIDRDSNDGGNHEYCDNTHCILSAGICGSQVGAGYMPALFWVPKPVYPFIESRRSASTQFRSRLEFSIFRPPIS